mmetsp:Transcript_35035/g.63028  ORF Transcript_35035/g.63028 Transcript_35035/m.63028 type:complete len:211 (+) Transcript_35035:58-690(+)
MGVPVVLNVYDLAPQNAWFYWCGVGIYHSGVEVYGVEYAYGGHEYDSPGIFATAPKEPPGQVVFRESILIGETDLSHQEVYRLVQQMGNEYKGNKYHLLQRNCNHFASDFCAQLSGKIAPYWINRLAGIAVMLHCLLPSSMVPPLILPTVNPLQTIKDSRSSTRDDYNSLLVPGLRSDMPEGTMVPGAVTVFTPTFSRYSDNHRTDSSRV